MENYTKLSIKYLKFQKKRTILTILGVALASGILFVILTLYFSNFINTRDALRKQADYEIVLLPEQNQDVSALLKQDFVKTAYRGKYYDYYSSSYIENAIYINVKNPYRLNADMETIEQTYGVKAQLNQQLAAYYLQGDTGNDTYIILLMFLVRGCCYRRRNHPDNDPVEYDGADQRLWNPALHRSDTGTVKKCDIPNGMHAGAAWNPWWSRDRNPNCISGWLIHEYQGSPACASISVCADCLYRRSVLRYG